MPTPAASSSTARRVAVGALVVVLLLAQTLAWVHRSLHGSSSESWRHGSAVTSAVQHGAVGALQDLFSTHADTSDCRLFDVLGQPGCAPAPLVFLPTAVPLAVLAATHADFVARWAALFDARGPPSAR